MGVYFLRNLLFLRVNLLEPKAITLCCLVLGLAWTTIPLLSQHLDLLPSWFCGMTWSPILRGGSSLLPCFGLLCRLDLLGANVSFFLPGISQVRVACQVCFWLCSLQEVTQVTAKELGCSSW